MPVTLFDAFGEPVKAAATRTVITAAPPVRPSSKNQIDSKSSTRLRRMDAVSETPASITFGRFRVLRHRRELLVDDRPIKLGGRAFDVLMALIETPGAVVDKDKLMRRVWPDRVVEENNLQVQISALRAAFGAERDIIRTVAGRGYQSTGEIRSATTDETSPPAALETSTAPAAPIAEKKRLPRQMCRSRFPN